MLDEERFASGAAWVKHIPTDAVTKQRRHIHQNPELSFKGEQTSRYAESDTKSLPNV